MATSTVEGKIIGVSVGGKWLLCQVDSTLAITVAMTEQDLCKPDGDTAPSGTNNIPWINRTADSRDWNIKVSQNLIRQTLAAANFDFGQNLVNGNVYLDNVLFKTATGQTESDNAFVYSGSAIISDFSLSAPTKGGAKIDTTLTGNGPLTYTKTPVTT